MDKETKQEFDSLIEWELEKLYDKVETLRTRKGIEPSKIKRILSDWELDEGFQEWWEMGDGEWE